MIRFGCILLLVFSLTANAQKEKVEAYIARYKEIAIQEMIRSGVPASITLAQGILESQSGESDLVKRSNNHFGIKCKPEWTGPRTYHDDDEKGECFRVYDSPENSFKDHSDFLRTRAHYAFLFKLNPTDYEGWANGLKKAGYATAPTYPAKLIKLINDYQLQQYTTDALARISNPKIQAPETRVTPVVTTTASSTPIEKEEEEESSSTTPAPNKKTNTPVVSTPFEINATRVVFVPAGTSLLALANKYEIAYSRLLNFNDMDEVDILEKDQLVYLEKKQKKGITDFHEVKAGETLFSIAQANAIRMESLLLYNNLTKDTQPSVGTKLKLKP
ncbi:MAG: glucosaminidase domain-containing protein [Sediminibacterium sp.]|jgi:LysM repeat protein|nr:glucosaminidase domain-containing protein [Chitinophagaceae bacterium]